MAFHFYQTGLMTDGELELRPPGPNSIDALLRSCSHPLCANDAAAGATTRSRVNDFLRAAPGGLQPGDVGSGRAPSYHFWMHLHRVNADQQRLHGRKLPKWGEDEPPIEIAGGIALRIGTMLDLELYGGHIGYNVYPPARGNHFAERACRLLFPLARAHGLKRLWITCNPDNFPSRRTCERLGCHFADIVDVPPSHPLHQRGDKQKCRYWIDI